MLSDYLVTDLTQYKGQLGQHACHRVELIRGIAHCFCAVPKVSPPFLRQALRHAVHVQLAQSSPQDSLLLDWKINIAKESV